MWSRDNLRRIVDWLEAAYPLEGCGLVLETLEGGYRVQTCENLADEFHARDAERYPRTGRDSYILNPIEMMQAEERGERVVVIFHSHPDVGDYFSQDDIAGALMSGGLEGKGVVPNYPGVDYLVVSVRGGHADRATLYRFDDGQRAFVEAVVFSEPVLQQSLNHV